MRNSAIIKAMEKPGDADTSPARTACQEAIIDTIPLTAEEYRLWWTENTDIPYGLCWCGCGEKTNLSRQTRTDRGQVIGEPVRYLHNHHSRRITDAQILQAVSRYEAGESTCAIARKLSISDESVRRRLMLLGIPLRSMSTAIRRHTLNESAFTELTPESAYWIGFLFADGHIRPAEPGVSPRIALLLSIKDKGHVEKFREFVGSSHAITIKKPHSPQMLDGRVVRDSGSASIVFSSTHMATDLRRHGMSRNSLARKASTALAYSRDFWRGVVDGDGWLRQQSQRGAAHLYARLGLCGGRALVTQFLDYAKTVTPTRAVVTKRGKIWIVNLCSKPANRVIRALYHENSVALDRKHMRAEQIMASVR